MSRYQKEKDKKQFVIRIIALVLVGLMLIGSAYAAIVAIIFSASAADDSAAYKINGDTKANIYVACGIYYGTTAQNAAHCTTEKGFYIGESLINKTERKYTPYFKTDATSLQIAPLTFLAKKSGSYLPASESSATVLPYRVELSSSKYDIWEMKSEIDAAAGTESVFCVKAISGGDKKLRYGAFSDAAEASVYAGEIEALLSETVKGVNVNISIPTGTGLCIIGNDTVLFEYDNLGDLSMSPAIYPIKNDDGSEIGTRLANKHTYFGAMCFLRSGDNIASTNLLELNVYVQGVLPSEIYASWPMELKKAFSIIVRSYTVSCLGGKHFSSNNFDLCNTADCQAYKGRTGINESIIQAVKETGYNVMACNGKIGTAYYAAANGGESIGTEHAWSSPLPHIISQKTPWEKYTTYNDGKGYWFVEYSPASLKVQLRSKGYTEIKSNIKSITVNSRAGETNYVYSTTYKDTSGNSKTILRTSKNYGALGLKSGNYDIGFSTVNYHLDHVQSINVKRIQNGNQNPLISFFDVLTSNNRFSISSASANVLTGSSQNPTSLPTGTLYVQTANGIYALPQATYHATEPDENGRYTTINVYGDTVITTVLQREYLTYKVSSGNIGIVGKGWGHGIGMSQYGARDLAEAGAEYDQIIRAYYANTKIITIRELRGLD